MTTEQQNYENTTTRIALVTGGGRGLGRSSALHLAGAGLDVVVTYRGSEEAARDVVSLVEQQGRRAAALALDTTEPGSFAAFARRLEETLRDLGHAHLDVLVNNAGSFAASPLGETEETAIAAMLDVHVTGPVLLTQALLPLLADGGRVVNTSTGLTRFTGEAPMAVYAAAKGAIEVYTRYLAKALGPRGITANVVAPGATATDFGGGYLRDDEQIRERLASVSAMGRVGEPDDIGAAVAAIVAPGMGWVTGQRIEASGGQAL